MNQLIVRISDGLGNQMFQYAFGRYLSHKLQKDLYIDISNYDNNHVRKFELDKFHTRYKIVDPDEVPLSQYNRKKHIILNKIYGFNKMLYYVTNLFIDTCITPLLIKREENFIQQRNSGIGFHAEYLNKGLGYYAGFWQSESYFPDMRDVLLQEFEPNEVLDDQNKKIQNIMHQTNSVSVHIRRGDYTIKKSLFRHSLYPCSLEYYSQAISYIKKKVSDPVFFVFSDDPEWVQNNFSLENAHYISHNTGNNSYKDMILMSSCKHNIIANSTFSWWGAWLNKNIEKIVITPKIWFGRKYRNGKQNIIPSGWAQL